MPRAKDQMPARARRFVSYADRSKDPSIQGSACPDLSSLYTLNDRTIAISLQPGNFGQR